jgi:hypothetical protein
MQFLPCIPGGDGHGDLHDKAVERQTGVIDVASLAVTGNGAAIVLDSQANKLGAFGATNPASPNGPGSVVVKDTSGSLDMLTSNVATMMITVAGPVTQSGPIRALNLTVQGTSKDAIALDTQPNAIGTFAASNGSAPVGIKDADGSLDIAFIQGGPVNIVVDGPLTQSGFINATALTVTGTGAAITLDTQVNNVDSFGAVNPGGSVVFQDATGGLVLTKSNAGFLWIKAAGAVTQSAPQRVDLQTRVVGHGHRAGRLRDEARLLQRVRLEGVAIFRRVREVCGHHLPVDLGRHPAELVDLVGVPAGEDDLHRWGSLQRPP